MRAFYWRWLKTAFWRSLGPIDLWTGFAASILLLADHYLPKAGLMTTYGWQIPVWALASVMTVRLLLAPYWMWVEDQAGALPKDKKECLDRLASKMLDGTVILNRIVKSEDALAVWDKDASDWTDEVYAEIESNFGKPPAVSFRTVGSVMDADMPPSLNRQHNSKKLHINKRIENLRTFIDTQYHGTR